MIRRPSAQSTLPRRSLVFILIASSIVLAACSADDSRAPKLAEPGTTLADDTSVDGTATAVVQYAQEGLSKLGFFSGEVDGQMTPEVRAAVRGFQIDRKLPPTGRFDADTVKAMASASPDVASLLVSAIQAEMTDLGFYTGLIDGRFVSDEMTAATRALQTDAGITVDGIFGAKSYDALQRAFATSVGLPEPPPTSQAAPAPTTTTTAAPGAATTTVATDVSPTTVSSTVAGQVADAQRRLTELHYRPGPVDGRAGVQLASAVLAFQKREGLERTSRLDPDTLARLEQPAGAGPRSDAPGPRVEIDLDRQVLFFVDATGTVTTINTSTGSGETYRTGGGTATAYTPTGSFRIERRIDGIRHAPLGSLYRPMYFKGGWAIHGSPSIPSYPASHGCARTANWDQDFLFPILPDGAPVEIYGTSLGNPDNAQPGY